MRDEKEQHEEIEETLDFTKPAYTFIPKGRHTYRQNGYYLVCKSCDINHAVFIGPDKIMVGEEEDGTPILKKRIDVVANR